MFKVRAWGSRMDYVSESSHKNRSKSVLVCVCIEFVYNMLSPSVVIFHSWERWLPSSLQGGITHTYKHTHKHQTDLFTSNHKQKKLVSSTYARVANKYGTTVSRTHTHTHTSLRVGMAAKRSRVVYRLITSLCWLVGQVTLGQYSNITTALCVCLFFLCVCVCGSGGSFVGFCFLQIQ